MKQAPTNISFRKSSINIFRCLGNDILFENIEIFSLFLRFYAELWRCLEMIGILAIPQKYVDIVTAMLRWGV